MSPFAVPNLAPFVTDACVCRPKGCEIRPTHGEADKRRKTYVLVCLLCRQMMVKIAASAQAVAAPRPRRRRLAGARRFKPHERRRRVGRQSIRSIGAPCPCAAIAPSAPLAAMPKRNLAPAESLPWRAWYSLQRWRARAKRQLRVDPLCCLCKEQGRITPATIADHFPPHGGDYNAFMLGPLRSLCRPCHDGLQPWFKHRGYSSAIGDDGYPLDKNHPFNRSRS